MKGGRGEGEGCEVRVVVGGGMRREGGGRERDVK